MVAAAGPTVMTQTTNGVAYNLTMAYGRSGAMRQMGYPSGRVVNFGEDTAGRLNGVEGVWGGQTTAYAVVNSFAAHGAPLTTTYGNGLRESWEYSGQRLQARRVRWGTATELGSAGEWSWSYCSSGTYLAECVMTCPQKPSI